MNRALCRQLVAAAESCRLEAYDDATGSPVPAGGTCIGNLTIGYGSTTDVAPGMVITQAQADSRLDSDLGTAIAGAEKVVGPTWTEIDDVRQAALVDMCFTLGAAGLAGFKNMIAAVRVKGWYGAYQDCLNSKWDSEAKGRDERDARMLLSGKAPLLP